MSTLVSSIYLACLYIERPLTDRPISKIFLQKTLQNVNNNQRLSLKSGHSFVRNII